MKQDFVQELKWRGMLQDMMPGTEEQLNKEMTIGYIGFDPTADSLHVGSLAQILTLVRFQQAGHKPLALVGGATGMVGDPSGKTQERQLLDEASLQRNVAGIQAQLERFLDFNCGANSAEIVNNYDWFKNYSFLDFIRDAGKHITVNYMMAKDSVKKRLEGDSGMSFTEFSYQLIQGFDFYHLWKERQCKLQMGGSDQWGNITTGTEFIRRKAQGEAFALTTQLIKKADGTKFGKSEGGNIWLDAEKTSPYDFYQFWVRTNDVDAESYLKIFTFLKKSEVDSIIDNHRVNPGARVLQKALAEEVTTLVHGKDEFEKAKKKSESLFSLDKESLIEMKRMGDFVAAKEKFDAPTIEVENRLLEEGVGLVDLLVSNGIISSKGEARKMIQNGGIYIDCDRVSDVGHIVKRGPTTINDYFLIQKGKKNFYWINFI